MPYNWGKARKTHRVAEMMAVGDPDFPLLGDADRHFFSVDVFQAAYLTGSPHQLTSIRISRLETWYVRRSMGLPNRREFTCYQCTRVHWLQCEDTWTAALVVSWYVSERRTSKRDTHSPSWDEWAAYTAEHHSWWTDRFTCSVVVPAFTVWAAFFPTWSICFDQVSRLPKVTRR